MNYNKHSRYGLGCNGRASPSLLPRSASFSPGASAGSFASLSPCACAPVAAGAAHLRQAPPSSFGRIASAWPFSSSPSRRTDDEQPAPLAASASGFSPSHASASANAAKEAGEAPRLQVEPALSGARPPSFPPSLAPQAGGGLEALRALAAARRSLSSSPSRGTTSSSEYEGTAPNRDPALGDACAGNDRRGSQDASEASTHSPASAKSPHVGAGARQPRGRRRVRVRQKGEGGADSASPCFLQLSPSPPFLSGEPAEVAAPPRDAPSSRLSACASAGLAPASPPWGGHSTRGEGGARRKEPVGREAAARSSLSSGSAPQSRRATPKGKCPLCRRPLRPPAPVSSAAPLSGLDRRDDHEDSLLSLAYRGLISFSFLIPFHQLIFAEPLHAPAAAASAQGVSARWRGSWLGKPVSLKLLPSFDSPLGDALEARGRGERSASSSFASSACWPRSRFRQSHEPEAGRAARGAAVDGGGREETREDAGSQERQAAVDTAHASARRCKEKKTRKQKERNGASDAQTEVPLRTEGEDAKQEAEMSDGAAKIGNEGEESDAASTPRRSLSPFALPQSDTLPAACRATIDALPLSLSSFFPGSAPSSSSLVAPASGAAIPDFLSPRELAVLLLYRLSLLRHPHLVLVLGVSEGSCVVCGQGPVVWAVTEFLPWRSLAFFFGTPLTRPRQPAGAREAAHVGRRQRESKREEEATIGGDERARDGADARRRRAAEETRRPLRRGGSAEDAGEREEASLASSGFTSIRELLETVEDERRRPMKGKRQLSCEAVHAQSTGAEPPDTGARHKQGFSPHLQPAHSHALSSPSSGAGGEADARLSSASSASLASLSGSAFPALSPLCARPLALRGSSGRVASSPSGAPPLVSSAAQERLARPVPEVFVLSDDEAESANAHHEEGRTEDFLFRHLSVPRVSDAASEAGDGESCTGSHSALRTHREATTAEGEDPWRREGDSCEPLLFSLPRPPPKITREETQAEPPDRTRLRAKSRDFERRRLREDWKKRADAAAAFRMDIHSALRLARGIALGCAYLQRKGLYHHRLHPGKILVDEALNAKLIGSDSETLRQWCVAFAAASLRGPPPACASGGDPVTAAAVGSYGGCPPLPLSSSPLPLVARPTALSAPLPWASSPQSLARLPGPIPAPLLSPALPCPPALSPRSPSLQLCLASEPVSRHSSGAPTPSSRRSRRRATAAAQTRGAGDPQRESCVAPLSRLSRLSSFEERPLRSGSEVALDVAEETLELRDGGGKEEFVAWLQRLNWASPEELLGYFPPHARGACDIHAFGVILWQMLSGLVPFQFMSPAQIIGAVGLGRDSLPDLGPQVPLSLRVLIRCCTHPDPRRRPSFHHIVSHLVSAQEEANTPAEEALIDFMNGT
ncbi:hypothetical protein BESB_019990 [Besnoitia besnoiti]|uniref:Protein kinase domain-containing protein n=1 Tax=Besnoitia besnoiti TaxID=94643 RepID=A0A2A9M0D7_BESBE|nr:hypothetical protein BESB_019990 [Besnoitia besnoiti]PFH32058.1 hypothetical protein BESB_019990 [Besnoitia besnoiti]